MHWGMTTTSFLIISLYFTFAGLAKPTMIFLDGSSPCWECCGINQASQRRTIMLNFALNNHTWGPRWRFIPYTLPRCNRLEETSWSLRSDVVSNYFDPNIAVPFELGCIFLGHSCWSLALIIIGMYSHVCFLTYWRTAIKLFERLRQEIKLVSFAAWTNVSNDHFVFAARKLTNAVQFKIFGNLATTTDSFACNPPPRTAKSRICWFPA